MTAVCRTSPRLFTAAPLGPGATVEATAAQAHYLAHVMRRGVGDPLVLFNGEDGEWRARLAHLGRNGARFTIIDCLRPQRPDLDLHLLFAPLKRDATELVIEKATELGVSVIQPVFTARTNTTRLNADRLDAIAREAAEQCERMTLPLLRPAAPLHEVLARWDAARRLVALLERSDAEPVRPMSGPAALLTGPEGGFTPTELDALARTPFVTAASLGPRIYRAETAVIAGLALIQADCPPLRCEPPSSAAAVKTEFDV